MSGPAMTGGLPLAGVRVIEVAEWVFVPTATALLADWGAQVIKVEHPERGDGFRGLVTQGVLPLKSGRDPSVELVNRGKRSVGIDLRSDGGRGVLHRLVAGANVFVTSLLPGSLERLGLGVDDLREHNPHLVYGRGHGYGLHGPAAGAGAFDTTAFWARSGLADALTQPGAGEPNLGRIAMGDRAAATNLAFGLVAALLRARTTGEPAVVDVSLLGSAMWTIAGDFAAAAATSTASVEALPPGAPAAKPALIGAYRTRDDRFIALAIIQPTVYFAELCARLGREELTSDPRFAHAAGHLAHGAELRVILEEAFAGATFARWCERFADASFPWSPVQRVDEVLADEQVTANGYLGSVEYDDGETLRTLTGPVQIDESPPPLLPAPAHGADTDEVLAELGYSWDEVVDLKVAGAVV